MLQGSTDTNLRFLYGYLAPWHSFLSFYQIFIALLSHYPSLNYSFVLWCGRILKKIITCQTRAAGYSIIYCNISFDYFIMCNLYISYIDMFIYYLFHILQYFIAFISLYEIIGCPTPFPGTKLFLVFLFPRTLYLVVWWLFVSFVPQVSLSAFRSPIFIWNHPIFLWKVFLIIIFRPIWDDFYTKKAWLLYYIKEEFN